MHEDELVDAIRLPAPPPPGGRGSRGLGGPEPGAPHAGPPDRRAGSTPAVELPVLVGEQGEHELLRVDAPAAVLVEGLEERRRLLGPHAHAHLVDHVDKLLDAELAVIVCVKLLEQPRHVRRGVAPQSEAVPRPHHQQETVAVLPSLGEGLADDGDRHGHVEHAAEHERPSHQAAAPSHGMRVAVADRRHRHDAQPHGRGQGVDVVRRLHDVDQRGEDHDEDGQQKEQDLQCLHGLPDDVQEELELLEPPDKLQQAEGRHGADKHIVHEAVLQLPRQNKTGRDAERDRDGG
mmetsp:Transcript_50640/g.159429  ORF Transcript_50640/g.159429 Transcript_50640/m.159429 type:complete len:291 (+) Transcript_50640:432-1304(+)